MGSKFININIRPLTKADQEDLWHWLHLALWDPPPAPLRPIEVLEHPGVRIYAEDWGRHGDVGVVTEVDGVSAGACWMRLVPNQQGLAYVDEETPQLGISLKQAHHGKGHGRNMLEAALQAAWSAGFPAVSLTVHPENPAIALYQKCGFRYVESKANGYHLMVVKNPSSSLNYSSKHIA